MSQATSVSASEASPAAPAQEAHGTLTIKHRVVQRTAMHSLRTKTSADRDPEVHVKHFAEDHVELAASVTLAYPDEPIGTVLDRLRDEVAHEVGIVVGRPIGSIDLTVDEFRTAPARRRRVV